MYPKRLVPIIFFTAVLAEQIPEQSRNLISPGLTTIGAPFSSPGSCPLPCTLTFGTYAYVGPSASFTTRSYSDSFPGPTIVVSAGSTFQITVVNSLQNIANSLNANTTNVHTHGLHVSGRQSEDNVFQAIAPGTSFTSTYTLPANHMGGTFYYHPHLTKTAGLQSGGGALGMLIVQDAVGALPPQVASMPDVQVLMSFITPGSVTAAQLKSNNALWVVKGSRANIFLTNGQTSPVFTMAPGTWHRFRFVFTSDGSIMELKTVQKSGSAVCQLQLLAKDGMYLPTAPRLITMAYLAQASRADIAIQCTGIGAVNLVATVHTPEVGSPVSTYVAMTLNVNGINANQPALPSFSVIRPCYLATTLNSVPAKRSRLVLGTGNPNTKLNDVFFSSPSQYLDTFAVGTLNQIDIIQGVFVHTLHIHVNPFQLTYAAATVSNTYFQVGDWHDIINIFTPQVLRTNVTLRFWADRFTGNAVVHCHALTHEDQGMMNTYLITGVEGTVVDRVALIADPTCKTGDSTVNSFVLK